MKRILLSVFAILSAFNFNAQNPTDCCGAADGFAAVIRNANIKGVDVAGVPVTGGRGGTVVVCTNAIEIKDAIGKDDKPVIALVQGKIDLGGNISMRSNKTILGIGDNPTITGGGLEMNSKKNIIFQNINFEYSPDDLIKINSSTNIWIDHCTFSDGPQMMPNDGLLDIALECDFITISYCKFFNHSKNMLIGNHDGDTQDGDNFHVTVHHCWFNGTEQRNPRVRWGTVHCYNNLQNDHKYYAVVAACSSKVVVENTHFTNCPYPIHAGYMTSGLGYVVQRNNVFVNCGANIVTDGTYVAGSEKILKLTPIDNPHTWEPSTDYSYTLEDAATLPATLPDRVGYGKLPCKATDVQEITIERNLDIAYGESKLYFKGIGNVTIQLTSINGDSQIIFQGTTASTQSISLNGIKTGIYAISLIDEKGIQTKKFIQQ